MPPVRSSFTFAAPCTLWQEAQVILPSRTGMWLYFSCLLTIVRWQVAQSAVSLAAFSSLSPFGAWTSWHDVHPTLRWSCWLPPHRACAAFEWQLVHTALAALADIFSKRRIFVLSPPASTCALPAPWQPSQPRAAFVSPWHVWHPVGDIGLPARYARACGPCLVAAPLSS